MLNPIKDIAQAYTDALMSYKKIRSTLSKEDDTLIRADIQDKTRFSDTLIELMDRCEELTESECFSILYNKIETYNQMVASLSGAGSDESFDALMDWLDSDKD